MLDTKGNRITYFGHSTFSMTTAIGAGSDHRSVGDDESEMPGGAEKGGATGRHFSLRTPTGTTLGDLLALAKQHKPKIVAIFETCLWVVQQRI